MALVVSPPGVVVGFTDPAPSRFAPPSTANRFALGFFERGSVLQVSSTGGLRAFGGHTNYSTARDAAAVMLAEGAPTVTLSRITGPAATVATVTLMDGAGSPAASIKIDAPAVGASYDGANGGLAATVTSTAGESQITITDGGQEVAKSPSGDLAALTAWALTIPATVAVVTVVGTVIPAAIASAPLVGGSDDRAGVTTASIEAALAALDRRFGPGVLVAPGIVDPSAQAAILAHCASHNRVAFLDQPADTTEGTAISHAASVATAAPDEAWRGGSWASWGYARPIGGEPERLVPWSAVQAGIASRVELEYGIGQAPFGPSRAASLTVTRLAAEWSTSNDPPGAVQRLYAARVNTAVDDGQAISAWGFKTLDPDETRSDLHVAMTRMRLAWQGELVARDFLGAPVDRSTLASFHGRLDALCKEFVAAGAINADRDAGYFIDVDGVNDTASMARRELHAVLWFRATGSADWIGVSITGIYAADSLGA